MIPLTLGEVADIVGGKVVDGDESLRVTGPAFLDSRAPEPGGLFVAFAGEHVDGHDFAARRSRAVRPAYSARAPPACPRSSSPTRRPRCRTLARHVLRRLRERTRPEGRRDHRVPGQDRAKDMLARVLADAGPTVATAGPSTTSSGCRSPCCGPTPTTRYLVLEMGARGIGHLAELCEIAPPDISLVLNVGKAHIGEFGSQANIALAKGELVEALSSDGAAVLNADDPLVAAMAEPDAGPVLGLRPDRHADVRLGRRRGRRPRTRRPSTSATRATEHVALRLVGRAPGASNAAATAATALAAGLPLGRRRREPRCHRPALAVADGGPRALRRPRRPQRRLQRQPRLDGLRAGDARPDRGALGAAHDRGARRDARARERAPRRSTGPSGPSPSDWASTRSSWWGRVPAPSTRASCRARCDGTTRHVETVERAGEWLRENVAGHDVVLVKASRAGRLERVADMLLGHGLGTDQGEEPGR